MIEEEGKHCRKTRGEIRRRNRRRKGEEEKNEGGAVAGGRGLGRR